MPLLIFDQVAGAIFVDGFAVLLNALAVPEWLVVLLADGAGGGVQVVATFIPIIGFCFWSCLYLKIQAIWHVRRLLCTVLCVWSVYQVNLLSR